MAIYKRGNIWWVEYRKDGKLVRRSTGMRERARAKSLESVIMSARSGTIKRNSVEQILGDLFGTERQQTPLSDVWDIYERTARGIGRFDDLSKTTVINRRSHLNQFIRFTSAETLEEVDGPLAGLFAAHLVTTGAKAKTRKNTIATLGIIWQTLGKTISGLDNPWRGLTPHDTDGVMRQPFTREQELAVLKAAKDMPGDWWIMSLISRHTGLRYGDCAHLAWSDVDLKRQTISVTPSKTKRHGVKLVIPIAPPLLMALKTLSKGAKKDALISPIHAAMAEGTNGALKRKFKFSDVLKAAGIDGDEYTFHSWRHTARTRLAEAGVDQATAKKILGHLTDEMSEHYDHADHLAEMRQALSAASV